MTINPDTIKNIEIYVQKSLNNPGSHGFDHTRRVTDLACTIGSQEGADMNILIPAALFHDIARPLEKETGVAHEKEGARIATEYLASIRYPEEYIDAISHAIRTHRFRSDEEPETLEAKILSDADKLDAIGAVGIARTFISAGEHNRDIMNAIDHMHDKLIRLHAMMYTTSGAVIAEQRHHFLCLFLQTITDEIGIDGPDVPVITRN